MGNELFWQTKPADDRTTQRIARMTEALVWLRDSEESYVIFGDAARRSRYVQFANDGDTARGQSMTAVLCVPLPILVAVGGGSSTDGQTSAAPPTPWWPWPPAKGYFGEPDHEPLLMEVGSGLWPGSSPRGLAGDDTVVARLAELGLHLGGGSHACRNFCRDGITEPSDILATLSDEIMTDIVHARPDYRLTVRQGQFSRPQGPVSADE